MAVSWFISCGKELFEALSVKSVVQLISSRVCLCVHGILYELYQTTKFIVCY